MSSFKEEILNNLNSIKGEGSFISHHVASFHFPGLVVKEVGEISYPINEALAKELIQKANKAPFGKGSKTIIDTKVRSAWEIDASDLSFTEKGWDKFIQKLTDKIKPDLGLEDYRISAVLYKMLIYEEGDFFLAHKDSEKEKGMFGSLIIGLPSKHTGGELLVRFDGKEEVVDFAEDTGNFKMPFVAFYADCEHEIKPLTSGYRICLIYNLVQQKAAKMIRLEPLEEHVKRIAGILTKELRDEDENSIKIILLGHQYTPENYSMEALKLNDRGKAETLIRAAKQAGYYAKMCLITSYKSGIPEFGGGYYGDDIDEDAEMEEVNDESLSIEHWMDDGIPSLEIQFEEDDLIASFQLDEDEPIVKEVEGYMGNYGPDLMHWYHYGAVVLWPKKRQTSLMMEQDAETKLNWIAYYNKQENLSEDEIAAAEFIMLNDLSAKHYKNPDYSAVAGWLIKRNDEEYFADTGKKLLQDYFVKMDTGQLVNLAGAYPGTFTKTIDELVTHQLERPVFEHYLSLLNLLVHHPELNKWAISQVKTIPTLLSLLIEKENAGKSVVKKETWKTLLELEKAFPQSTSWVTEMTNLITTYKQRNYINDVLVAEIIISKQKTPLALSVMKVCEADLQHRVDNKPLYPENWTRTLPDTKCDAKQWAILASFLQSPTEMVFDFRKNQSERSRLERAIQDVRIDLKTETIRKGSPHTLRITKTVADYQRQLRQWEDDVVLLEKQKKQMGELK
jgi:hypothetical protein